MGRLFSPYKKPFFMPNYNRRSFLTLSSTLALGLAAPKLSLGQSPRKIRVALLGLGSYSTYQLAPALQLTQYCELKGIITGSPNKISNWQRKYHIEDKNVYSYDNMDEIASNDDIDVVYVVTPTGTHARFVIAAANAGKHVWCEKPMAMTETECRSMIAACNKNGVQLTLGYRVQHEPNTQTLNGYAQSRPFGIIKSADAAAGYAGGGGSGWRFQKKMGGGALYDMGVYTVNGIRNALQMEPVEVISAKQYTSRPSAFREVDETTEYTLRFERDITAKGKTSVGQGMNHLRVNCESGWYEMRPMQTYNGVRGSRSDGKQLNIYLENQQAKQMDDDAFAMLNNRPFQINPDEGLKDIRIIEAIIESSDTGRSVSLS